MDERTRALFDVAGSVLGDLDLDGVIDRVLESARELTGARYAALGVLDASRTQLDRFITAGMGEEAQAGIGALPRGRGVLGELILNPIPLRLAAVSEHPHSYGFPPGHPPMHSFLGVPIIVSGRPFGSLYLAEKADADEFSEVDEESAVTLARFAGLAIDHANRHTGAAARGNALARTVTAFEATAEITRAVGGVTDLRVILELVAKRGRALVGARALLIELVDGDELVVAAGVGDLPPGLIDARFELADTVASAALRTGATQRLEVQMNRARFEQHGLGRLGLDADAGLVVPLVFRGRGLGVLIAVDALPERREFSVEDQRLLEAFATSAATAVATGRNAAADLQRQRLAAAEAERGRWARELHDETLQSLGGLRIILAGARRVGDLHALQDAVSHVIDDLDEGIATLRALVTDLRPAALDDLGLAAAVEGLSERASGRGLDVDCSIDLAHEQGREPTRLTAELETTVYRIIQEALTNASKHGNARRVIIEALETSTSVDLTVRDDGSGFDQSRLTAGFGLLGIRERVELLHGAARIESAPGAGTTVTASLPVQRRPRDRTVTAVPARQAEVA